MFRLHSDDTEYYRLLLIVRSKRINIVKNAHLFPNYVPLQSKQVLPVYSNPNAPRS
jgi:hypothetical protein